MTNTLLVTAPDDTTDPCALDSIPITWSRPSWAVEVHASDGYLLYYGHWVVANPGAQRADQIRVRLSGSDEFQLEPEGAIVAVAEPVTVEITGSEDPSVLSAVIPVNEALALAAVLRVLCSGASAGQLAA